jgi:aminoglycoside N3'-acetyltransferase
VKAICTASIQRTGADNPFVPRGSSDLSGDLHALGLSVGDVVMVHASLRAIGPVEGGAAGVVRSLEDAIGSNGTLLMNLGARDDYDWINNRPESERVMLLEQAPPFDALTTPADPDVGVLAEVFHRLPGTVVNDHPDGRFGARGRLARQLLAEPLPWDDYYGPGSVLERFTQAGGKVLRLGADPDTVTLLHLAEYRVDLPDKRRVVRHHKVAGPSGLPEIRTVSCLDDSNGIAAWEGENYFALILHDYLAHERGRKGRVGGAFSELIDATDLLDHGVAWMRANLI